MSFLTTAYLMEKHGLRLDLEALANAEVSGDGTASAGLPG